MKHFKHIFLFCCCFALYCLHSAPSEARSICNGQTILSVDCGINFSAPFCMDIEPRAITAGGDPSDTDGMITTEANAVCGGASRVCGYSCGDPYPPAGLICGECEGNPVVGISSSSDCTNNGFCWNFGTSGGSQTGGVCYDGAPVSCSSINGSCGGSANTCSSGSPSGYSAGSCGGSQTWSCVGSGGGTTASCSIANAACVVNGSCGAANGVAVYSAPSSGLCGIGSATAVSGSGPFTWSCNGSGGGTNASCSAPLRVNGVCGASNNNCNAGTLNDIADTGTHYQWVCNGINGGTNSATCSQIIPAVPVNGTCGASHLGTFASPPSSNLCGNGSPTAVTTNSTTYTWSCNGSGGGSNASCNANRSVAGICGGSPASCSVGTVSSDNGATACGTTRIWDCDGINGGNTTTCIANNSPCSAINGACGTAHGYIFMSPPSTASELCSAGSSTSVTTSSISYNWSCNGSGGGTNANCESERRAFNGVCGSAHGGTFSSPPASNTRCNVGAVLNFTTNPTTYTWQCEGLSTSPTCTANRTLTPVAGTCGTANGGSFATAPTTNLCSAGNGVATPAPSGSGPWSWTCGGSGGGAASPTCSATQTAPVINGACGASNGGTFGFSTPPSSGFCNTGSATAVTTNPTTYTWSCNGSGGGTNSSCTATRSAAPINGSCGTANGVSVYSAPSSNLCGAGSATAVSGSGPFTWSCNGSGGGTNASCNAPLRVDGVCGPTHSTNVASTPSSGLCSAGNATAVSGTGPWTWSCTGINSGTTASCNAGAIINGSCGGANGVGVTAAPSSGLCGTGSATAVSGSGPWSWACNGSGGGTNASCSAPLQVSGSCGTANGVGAYSAPSSGLCGTGTATAVSGSGPFTWSCNGANGGSNSSCSAPLRVDGVCGSSNNGNFYTSGGITNQCSVGASSGISGSGPWTWTCAGSNGGVTASCNANRRIDGACGTANNVGTATAPSASLCGYTASPATVSGTNPNAWTWTCTGNAFGGTNASCGAPRNGACGTSNGGNFVTKAEITDQCSSGTGSPITGAGPYSWTCTGSPVTGSIPAGTTASCTAQLATAGECGPAHGIAWTTPPPASQLCQAGTGSAVLNPSVNNYTWTCNGINSPTNASCNSALIVKGTCNPITHLVPTATAPSSNLCGANNTATAVTGSGPWSWYCNGSPATPANRSPLCSAPLPPPPPNFGGACPGA